MLRVVTTGRFDKEYLLMHRRGKDLAKLEKVMLMLAEEKPLSVHYRDHPLKGNFKGRRDCHIEPDWILIYKHEPGTVVFERTGSHADLFE